MSDLQIVSIKKHKTSQNRIFLCPEVSAHFKKGEIITIHYGLEHVQARVRPIKHQKIVAFSVDVWDRLSIPFSHDVHIRIEEKSIFLGPLVGIMTTYITPHTTRPLGERTRFYQKYLLSQKDVPSSYFVFTPADISLSNKRVTGYFLRQQNGKQIWKRYIVPFPNVIYNRVFRRGEKFDYVIRGRAALEAAGTKTFNPYTFNKWNIHELISIRPDVSDYLPESIFNPSLRSLNSMLNKYKMIYLKPSDGYLGLGIIQISKHPKKGLLCRFNQNGENYHRIYPNVKLFIKQFFKGRSLSGYIAQQGIQLLRTNGRNIDFRVHVNKNQNGDWQLTGIAAKMAGKGSVTTHVRTGGHVLSYESVMKQFFPEDMQSKVTQKMEAAVLTLANAIEESLSGYVGEIAFDIGLDFTGHPWMFEANSQPGRHVFVLPSLKESEVITRRNILDYSLYLAGFTKKEVTVA